MLGLSLDLAAAFKNFEATVNFHKLSLYHNEPIEVLCPYNIETILLICIALQINGFVF